VAWTATTSFTVDEYKRAMAELRPMPPEAAIELESTEYQ